MIYLGFVALTVLVIAAIYFNARKSGRESAENKVMEETLHDVQRAQTARDNLLDPAIAKRVREKFTRE